MSIHKYISKKEQDNISVLEDAIKETSVLVTCMGLYNHGKSTLLNTLVDDFEHKTFKTADVRETSKNKKFKLNDIVFVDTPGLNAKDDDDKRVMDAVKESDINLFVHNVSTGEFAKKEIEFLQTVKKHWKNPQEFIDRTIFVLTRCDGVSESDIKITQQKMKQQIQEIFSSKSSFVAVSAKSYTKGKLEDKKLLVKKSNIDKLEQLLINLKDSLKNSIVKTKKERLERTYENLINSLNSKIQVNILNISQSKEELQKIEENFNNDLSNIETTLGSYYDNL
ncbi:MAG: GTPase [Campylobacterota bacterium]|nr:GTPase [Campylobacterota bacterium]